MTQQEIASQHFGRIATPCHRTERLACQPNSYSVEEQSNHTYRRSLVGLDNEKGILFQYTFAGQGEVIATGKRRPVPAGKAFLLLTPSHSTCMQSPDEDIYHFISLSLFGEAAQELAHRIIDKDGVVLTIPPESLALEMLCRHYNQLAAGEIADDPYEEAAFGYRFMLALLKEQLSKPSSAKENMPVCLEKTLAFIEHNLENTLLDLNAMAATANLSVFYFTRLFKEYIGCSPRKYLMSQRLYKAAWLLANDNTLTFKNIVEQCGFNSMTYFCRAFQKAYNISPGKYRNLYKSSSDN
ncbi:MAG: helix-turn-helix transcriptional regulator [Lentisphaeria bacterium]|nr:helix-turn-helix transcriptional regulator [Lentisphaeria bacterium]